MELNRKLQPGEINIFASLSALLCQGNKCVITEREDDFSWDSYDSHDYLFCNCHSWSFK